MRTLIAALLILCVPANVQAYELDYIGKNKTITAKHEDTLAYLARDHNLGYLELALANPNTDPWLPGAGTKIKVPHLRLLPNAPQSGIVINLPEMRLYAYIEDGLAPVTYPLGIGREGLETPTGTTHIWQKLENPTWRPTKRMREEDPSLPAIVKAGYENPLGSHALYLGWPQYMIHGTNRPFGIGRRVSSGCIRMYPEAIKKLYQITPTGTKVHVIDQPIKAGWVKDSLYIEAHPTMKQATQIEEEKQIDEISLSEAEKDYIMSIAGDDHKDKIDWDKINALALKRNGVATKIYSK